MAGERILLLEDDEGVAELLMAVLHDAGYIVDPARTVAQAERELAARDYALVIADWRLPDGDGISIGTKTVILSGYALQMSPEKAERHEIWLKPMRPSELIAAVERCIGKDERGNN
jgi:DNA-binding NtrC family response regulator